MRLSQRSQPTSMDFVRVDRQQNLTILLRIGLGSLAPLTRDQLMHDLRWIRLSFISLYLQVNKSPPGQATLRLSSFSINSKQFE